MVDGESVLEAFNLLTVKQLLLYFMYKQTYTSINNKFYNYSVFFNHKYVQKPKTKTYSQLNCICDQNSVEFSLKILKMKLKLNKN